MAESKKSFVLYCDLIHTVEHLPNDKAGELLKHILSYVNDRDPVTDCIVVKLAFEPIRQQLKRDLQTWEKKVEERSESGRAGNLKRWNQDLYERYMNGECLDDLEKIARHRKASLPDPTRSLPIANIAVNGTVNGNGTVNENEKKAKVSPEKGNASPLTNERVKAACEYIIGYLNKKTGKAFKPDSKDTVRMIRARLSEGYEWPNFRTVIDGRCAIWGADPKMAEYLRPVTLFGTKFESYLNADATTTTAGSTVIKMNTEAYTR